MASDDTPGSPRKKVKLEDTSSIYAVVKTSSSRPDTATISEHTASTNGNMSGTTSTQEQQVPSEASTREQTDTSCHAAEQGNVALIPPDPVLDQLNKEKACGITEFVSPDLLGFSGVLKKRYTDFMVNEILPSGEVVHLTSLKAPKRAQPKDRASKQNTFDSTNEAPLQETLSPQKETQQSGQILDSRSALSAIESAPPISIGNDAQEKTKDQKTPLPHHGTLLPHLTTKAKSNTPPKSSPTKEARFQQNFYIRRTDDGWMEFDKAKGDAERKIEGSESLSKDATLDGESMSHTPKIENLLPMDNAAVGTRTDQPEKDDAPNASTEAQWQAYADRNGESDGSKKINDEDKTILLSYFTDPVVDGILSLYNRILNSPRRATRDYGTVKSAIIDRQLRTKIHQDVRRIFQSRLETMTDRDGAMIVSAMPPATNSYNHRKPSGDKEQGQASGRDNHKGSRGQSGAHGKPNWQDLGGEFLHFTLHKENKDTMECVSWLSKVLKLGPRAFEFAGTKDRRAISVQRVSVYRQTIGRMIDAGKSLRQANIGDYEYRPHALQLGELTGNEFTITLRECKFGNTNVNSNGVDQAHAITSKALQNLVERGFINYYGLQRFGTFSTSTDDIGVRLLQGDFKSAVEAILHYTPELLAASQDAMSADSRISRDDKARAHAIHIFQTTGKAQHALANLPRKFSAESAIIRHLGSRPNQAQDFLGAIQSIQRNLRLMYVHAYQSLVWNMAASKRWSKYGESVMEGDLVLVKEHVDKQEVSPKKEEFDEDGEPIVQPATEDRATNVEDFFTRARTLSKEEAESGSYSVYDVVLPTPGFDILYPANEMEAFYEEFMASPRGGGLNPHDMRRPQKDFSLSGSYRKILAKPGKDTSFEIKIYERDDEQFVQTDMDRLNKARDASGTKTSDEIKGGPTTTSTDINKDQAVEKRDEFVEAKDLKASTSGDAEPDSEDNADTSGGVPLEDAQKKIAVILKLQLGSSQYATMALRELMKAGGVKAYKPDFGGGR